ncbi:cell wall/surface repeat protein containing internalin domain [Bifidobacterium adolescentis]|uniref:Cell wall/surface repeat protein containing internalin domain n=1 Tax=Bifidobacterium adolescentis TaxID=1680 RepID=A0A1X2Z2N5_BIFAD|nr:InlB B-repeat-containing protein [Bifidobacterium adolescentis]OSG88683.1 cell wall/surface repeat protein containing internalin domain [Bifidobacterium adolescentis]
MRKPIALLAAGSMMLMPLLGAASVVLTPVSEAYAETADSTASDYPEGVTAYLDGTRLASFDPSGNGDVYDATGQTVELSGVPDDWTVQWSSRVNEITNKDSIMYILSNGSTTYRYWFDGAEGAVHTVEELHGMTITLNGQAVDGDITQGFTIHDVTAGDMKGYENVPYGWVLDGDSEDDHYTYTAHPNDSDTPSVQYTFLYDDTRPHDSINSLRNLKAYLTVDGSAVKGFDYTLANTDTIAIPMNADVRLEGVPDGWKVDYNNPSTGKLNRVYTLTGPCGDTFTYIFHPTADYEGYYYIDQLQYVRAFADGELVDGFDYRGGAWSFPETTKNVEIANVPDDWNTQRSVDGNTITYVVSSPNNSVSVTYVFNIAKHRASLDELSNVKAIVGGNYVSGFNPKQSGIYEYEDGQGIAIVNVPSGWTQAATDGDGYKVYTLTSGDLSVSYRFNKHVKTYSVDELAKVSASTDDGVVQDFKPMESGTYTIGEHATVWITGVPDGWDTESSDNDMTYTVTSHDGKIKVVYTFKHAKHQYSASELKNVTAKLSNGDYLNGFDPVSGGEFTVPMGTKNVTIGHIPNGWNLTKNNGLSYTLTSSDGEVSVSYKFHAKNGHTVVFDTDGGTTVESQIVEDGETITPPDDYPSKTGYRFKGWYKDGVPYDFTQPVYDDAVITAKWTVNTYEVYFDAGASDDWYPMQTIAYGDKVVKPVDPTLDGYDFDGWLLDGKAYSFDTPVTADMTLTASWKTAQVQTHTVTFTGAGDDFAQTVADGSSATVPTVPSKKGYTFAGWYSGDSLYDFTTPVTDDLTVEAHWTKNAYTVSFDSNGGSDVDSQQVEYKDTASQPDNPTLDGYTFQGWTLDGDPYDFNTPVTSSITLKALWSKNTPVAKKHTVTFDSGKGSKVDSQTVKEGDPVSKPDNPAREGYTFNGWLLAGDPYDFTTPVMQDLTLTASWTKNKSTYTVKFDLNGGDGDIADQKVKEGSTIDRPDNPTREGYTFMGWQYEDSDWNFLNTVTSNMTLTAQWKRNEVKKYTVAFDTADGTSIDPQTIKDGGKVSKPDDPTREGYEFKGWTLNGVDYDFTAPVKADLVLTAVWTPVKPKTYTIMFDTDRGTVVPSQTVKDKGTATEPTAPTKTGYEFKGWLLDGKPYDFATPVTKDVTLKAKWEKTKVESYTVAFDSAGGSEVASQTVEQGKTAVKPDDPTREGYTFFGWYAGDAAYDWDTPVTGNLILTAHWQKNEQPQPKTYTVTFDYQNGSPSDARTVSEGNTVTPPENPVRDGYDFQGWVGIDGSEFDFEQPITSDTLVSAKWKKHEDPKPVMHTVTFNSNGGTSIDPQTVQDGLTVRRPADPVKNDYVFDGWYLDNDQYDFNKPVTGDITLTAIYHRKPMPQPNTYTVRFDTGEGSKVDPQTIIEGKTVIRPADPSMDGYDFQGWLLDGKDYDWNTPITGDMTLTASWKKHEEPKPVTHTVSFYTDGGSMVAQQTVNDGETVTVPDTPTKNGYTFSGWTLNGEPYDFNLPVTADITLKATWVENQKPQPKRHTVTFDTTGGSEIGQQTVDEGEKAIQPANPTREGYDFQGWLLNGQAYDWNTPITGDITLTASWTEKAPTLFTVAFNTGGASNIPSQKVKEGDKAARPTDPKRTGYTFTGWQLNGKDYDWNTPITTDIILTATWQKNETPKPVFYTVKFDTGNGSKIDLQTIQQGGKVKKPADPTLNGYKFVGWQLDGKDYDFNTAVSKDMTLTAMWEANTMPPTVKKHTVTVTLYDGKTERYEAKDGEKLTLPSNPTRDGYVFDGFIDKNGNVYDMSKPVVKDLTLTCVWKKANGVSSDKDKEIADASTNGTVGNGEQNSDSQNPLASTGAPIYGMVIAAIIAGLGGIGILLARLRSRDD